MEGQNGILTKEVGRMCSTALKTPRKHTFLFLVNEDGRVQCKLTKSYVKQFLNPDTQMKYKCITRH